MYIVCAYAFVVQVAVNFANWPQQKRLFKALSLQGLAYCSTEHAAAFGKMPHYEATLQSAPSESLQGLHGLLQCLCRTLEHTHGARGELMAMVTNGYSPRDAIDDVI